MDHFKESSSSCYSSSDDDDASNSLKYKPPSCEPIYEFSDPMAQLPIKRGLSKFYNGKSETFISLTNLKRNEDLEKKERRSYGTRVKSCKSYGQQHKNIGPKATITKRSPK